MHIAFVNQPLDLVRPPVQNSLGIWTYEVGRALSAEHEVSIYVRGGRYRFGGLREDGIHYRFVPGAVNARVESVFQRLPGGNDPRRPRFASRYSHRLYAEAIGRDLARQGCDVAHVLNYSQFIPVIRKHNPKMTIVLHMQCEWATQLDPAWMARRVADADLVLGCSGFIADRIADAFPQYASRCRPVFNGVDMDAFSPAAADKPAPEEDTLRILFVARVSPEKGVHVLMEAFQRVSRDFPQARLDVVGGQESVPHEFVVALSDDPLVLELDRYYQSNYLAHLRGQLDGATSAKVDFTGNLPYAELVARYRAADVFVFPSVWHEPFGMPNAEAMACGTPVVATRGGGIPEIVEDGVTGLLVERGDVAGLAKALGRLLADGEMRRAMGAAGRARAERVFSWKGIAADLVDAYEEMRRTPADASKAALT